MYKVQLWNTKANAFRAWRSEKATKIERNFYYFNQDDVLLPLVLSQRISERARDA